MRRVEPAGTLVGHIAVPGDKSISHRALLLGAAADGESQFTGFGASANTPDPESVPVQVDLGSKSAYRRGGRERVSGGTEARKLALAVGGGAQ